MEEKIITEDQAKAQDLAVVATEGTEEAKAEEKIEDLVELPKVYKLVDGKPIEGLDQMPFARTKPDIFHLGRTQLLMVRFDRMIELQEETNSLLKRLLKRTGHPKISSSLAMPKKKKK